MGQLYLNDQGRLQLDTIELEEGDQLEALIVDGLDGRTKWIETTVRRTQRQRVLP